MIFICYTQNKWAVPTSKPCPAAECPLFADFNMLALQMHICAKNQALHAFLRRHTKKVALRFHERKCNWLQISNQWGYKGIITVEYIGHSEFALCFRVKLWHVFLSFSPVELSLAIAGCVAIGSHAVLTPSTQEITQGWGILGGKQIAISFPSVEALSYQQ